MTYKATIFFTFHAILISNFLIHSTKSPFFLRLIWLCLFFFFFWPCLWHEVQRLKLRHNSDSSHISDNAGSLACWTSREFLIWFCLTNVCFTVCEVPWHWPITLGSEGIPPFIIMPIWKTLNSLISKRRKDRFLDQRFGHAVSLNIELPWNMRNVITQLKKIQYNC